MRGGGGFATSNANNQFDRLYRNKVCRHNIFWYRWCGSSYYG
nr:MAG TPA_asm: contryphan [Caudoviricetes sp.]